MARTRARVTFEPTLRPRRARGDELSVMRVFARHADHCVRCSSPCLALKLGQSLCERGLGYARDVAKYIYGKGGVPLSVIDKNIFDERIEIDVPLDCEVIRDLVRAFEKGISLQSRRRPVVLHGATHDEDHISPRRNAVVHFHDERGHGIEIKPASSRTARKETKCHSRYESGIKGEHRLSIVRDKRGSLYIKDEEARHAATEKEDAT
ncbi:hypothetical protein DV738_g1179, partial [Chaetothyriales sp. CBS 135597]